MSKIWRGCVVGVLSGFLGAWAQAVPVYPEVHALPGEEQRLAEIEAVYRSSWDRCEREAEQLLGVSHARNAVELKISRGRNPHSPLLLASTGGYGRRIEIEVYLEAHLGGLHHASTTLCHEMIHALMRKHVDGYRSLAPWIREGIATYFSGEYTQRFAEHVIRYVKRPEGLAGAVAVLDPEAQRGQGFGLGEYFESAAFFAYLDKRGSGVAQAWLRHLVHSKSPDEATQAVIHLDLVKALQNSRVWVQAELQAEQAAWPTGMLELALGFKEGVRLNAVSAKALYDAVVPQLVAQMAETANSSVTPLVMRRLVWAKYFWTRLINGLPLFNAELGELLQSMLATDAEGVFSVSQSGIPVSELFYDYGYLLRRLQNFEEAIPVYLRLRRYHLEQPNLRAASAVALGKSYYDLGQPAQAFTWLTEQPAPNLRIEPDTCWYLIRAALATGNRDRAREVFSIFNQEFGTSGAWKARIEQLRAQLDAGPVAVPGAGPVTTPSLKQASN